MEVALGPLRWSPQTFWASTFYELSNAWIGHCKSEGIGRWRVHKDGWSDVAIEEHQAEVAEMMERFPTAKKPKLGKAEKRLWKAQLDG